ncbi:MAG: precorrin-2 dehydrogenase/sirohydrochlorin ferrochelatase family protein [Terracidiphilus sp.]
MAELFPAFLKLNGRRCLVVGAGPVAESKVESLIRCGADVVVVAPKATGAIRDAALAGEIRWEPRPFRSEDLDGVFLVVAATPFPALHEEIFQLAQQAGVLCNAVDEPERCDFYYPSVVRRGPLQIAISTSGRSPFLAQRLRQELEQHFGPEYGPWTEELGRARSSLFARKFAPDERRAMLKEFASEEAFRQFRGH